MLMVINRKIKKDILTFFLKKLEMIFDDVKNSFDFLSIGHDRY